MKKLLSIISVFLVCLCAGCGTQRSQAYYDYASKVIQTHQDGTYAIRAWGRSRNATMSYEVAQKQALKDMIFHGVQAATGNITSLKPLLFDMNAERKYEDFFNAFFADNGAWKKFVSMKDRRVNTTNYSRTDTQVVAQVTVTVDRAALRQYLVSEGLLEK